MGTYADWWNAQQPPTTNGSGGTNGPVRLTISKGEYKLNEETGQLEYQELWGYEQGMEIEDTEGPLATDALTIELDKTTPGWSSRIRTETDEVMEDAGDLLKQSNNFSKLGRTSEFSLLVLDTNVLMSCLPLLKHLYSFLFNQNTQFLLGHHSNIAPFALIVPKMVLRELDGIKSSNRANNAESIRKHQQAQNANRWMLQALRTQKQWASHGVQMPEMLWALHVQTQEHQKHSAVHLSNDERIVALARHLQQETGVTVVLCSNDIHASLTAEAEGIATLELRSILASLESDDDRETAALAKDLLEQWAAQHRSSFAATGLQHSNEPPVPPWNGTQMMDRASSSASVPAENRPPFSQPVEEFVEMEMDSVEDSPLSSAQAPTVVPTKDDEQKRASPPRRIDDLPDSSASRWAPASRRGRR